MGVGQVECWLSLKHLYLLRVLCEVLCALSGLGLFKHREHRVKTQTSQRVSN